MTDNNVIDFPRIGFTLTPTTAPGTAVIEPPNTPTPDPTTPPTAGRRSPLDTLAALPDPGILQPLTPAPGSPAGHVPDTFRNEPTGDLTGPRLGALSLAAVLAVAVAALRGTHTVLSTWWENKQAQQADTDKLREARAKHQLAMQSIGDKAAQQQAKHRAPSSSEFGRKTLGNRAGGGGSGKPSAGPARSGSGTSRSPKAAPLSKAAAGGAGGKAPGKKPSAGAAGKLQSSAGKPTTSPGSKKTAPKTAPKNPGGNTPKTGGQDSKNNKRLKSPTGGKSPSSTASTPSMERTRARQERAAARNNGKVQRRADRQAARLENRAKDRDATRDRTNAAKEARKAAKNKVRDARIQAKGDRKEKARDARFDTKQQDRQRRAKAKRQKKKTANAAAAGRTTLAQAATKTARDRWKKRRKNLTPVLTTVNNRKAKKPQPGTTGPNQASKKTAGPGSQTTPPTSPKGAGQKPGSGPSGASGSKKGRTKSSRWAKARAYARKKAAVGGCFGGPGTPAGAATAAPGAAPGGSSGRRSPFGNAAQATAATTITVERADYPGAQAKPWQPAAITAGPEPTSPDTDPHPAQPGTPHGPHPTPSPSAPTPSLPHHQEARTMAAHVITSLGGHSMSAEHATEITLDDALDEADQFAQDAFKTHDECGRLAKKASDLRTACTQLAEELATKHNLIGRLFQGALARFAESMDLVDRMAQEMKTSSLEAAEMAEALSDSLSDAYRPYTQATADAGLTTPSAPIHNQV